ncbi:MULTISPECIES: SulA-like leucine-rich domain-containing protein [unclassified Alishewanella]|uniref:SulA-like leucine-rich domain-containing protein n=1 Tax=unclassified Alishewanella TaxID=2628974 RepID=UPI004040FA98
MLITSKTAHHDTQLRNSKSLNNIAVPSTQASAYQQHDNIELQLLKLLQQHRDVDGWIVLIAPKVKPNKNFWASCQIPLEKILMIHPHQVKDLAKTVQRAINSASCKVVLHGGELTDEEATQLAQLAEKQQTALYPLTQAMVKQH